MRDAGLGDVIDLGLEAVVPAALLVVRLPVEPLLEQIRRQPSVHRNSKYLMSYGDSMQVYVQRTWKRTCAWTRLQRATTTREKSKQNLLECFICLCLRVLH